MSWYFMKKINNSNKGFTLVELLLVIVIMGVLLGVGIAAVMNLIDKSKAEKTKSQEQLLVMAAKNYLQENRGLLPKSVGETTTIPIDVLKSNKYITEDIKNDNNETCMINSFVSAHKDSATKYSYKAHLYCGNDAITLSDVVAIPTVTIDFVDSTGKSIKNDSTLLEKVSEAKYIIEFNGGKNGSKNVAIDGYSYSILVKTDDDSSFKEVYSSGTLSASGANTIHIDRNNSISDYIDITGKNTVVIKAMVRNVEGGVSDGVKFLGSAADDARAVYQDKTAPVCGQIIGQAKSGVWITRITAIQEIKVSVTCSDGSGSGCVRNTFTKTWSGNVEKEYDNIQIKDNAGNKKNCSVRVNIDRKFPTITVDAYAKGKSENAITGDSVLNKTTNSSGVGIIQSSEYDRLISGYMTKAYYPYGVIYKINLKDLKLKDWKWEVNKNGINNTGDSNYEEVNSTSDEAKSGNCTNMDECVIYVSFTKNGLRKGMLTVSDHVGNTSTFTIYANIDRNGPNAPKIINSSDNTDAGTWTNASGVTLKLTSTYTPERIEGYYYTYNEDAEVTKRDGTTDNDANTKWVKLGGTGMAEFTTAAWTKEMNKTVYVMVCDTSGNCSTSSDTKIRIDRTKPTGMIIRGYAKNNSEDISSTSGLMQLGNKTWHKGWALVVPSGASDTGSGVVNYFMTVSGASSNVEEPVNRNYRNVNAEGISYVSFQACDAAKNCSDASVFEVRLDRTAPTTPEIVNTSNGEWTTANSVTLTVKNSSDSLSGVDKYYYTYSSSSLENGSNPSNQWVEMNNSKTWSDEINKTVYIRVCDKVGNCNSNANTKVRIDRTSPTISAIKNEDNNSYLPAWTNKSFSLIVQGNDSGSGLDECQYTFNSNATQIGDDSDSQWKINNGEFNSERTEFTMTKFSYERNQNVYIRLCDKVGNCSSKVSAEIKIDKTAPTCGNIEITQNENENGVNGTVSCSDSGGSECKKSQYSFESLKENTNIKIYDNATNERSCPLYITPYDCSTGDWAYQGNTACSGVSGMYFYESASCKNKNEFHPDICTVKCTSNLKSCCVRRLYKECYRRYIPE